MFAFFARLFQGLWCPTCRFLQAPTSNEITWTLSGDFWRNTFFLQISSCEGRLISLSRCQLHKTLQLQSKGQQVVRLEWHIFAKCAKFSWAEIKTEGVLGLQNVHREHKCAEDSLNVFYLWYIFFVVMDTCVGASLIRKHPENQRTSYVSLCLQPPAKTFDFRFLRKLMFVKSFWDQAEVSSLTWERYQWCASAGVWCHKGHWHRAVSELFTKACTCHW